MSDPIETAHAGTHSLTAPARPAFLTGVHELLDKLWSSHPALTGDDRARFESALIEVVGNVVVHSPVGSGRERVMMTVLVSCTPDKIVADVRDDGDAVDIDLEAAEMPAWEAETGRGLALARAMSDDLSYERTVDGNRWLITCVRGR